MVWFIAGNTLRAETTRPADSVRELFGVAHDLQLGAVDGAERPHDLAHRLREGLGWHRESRRVALRWEAEREVEVIHGRTA